MDFYNTKLVFAIISLSSKQSYDLYQFLHQRIVEDPITPQMCWYSSL